MGSQRIDFEQCSTASGEAGYQLLELSARGKVRVLDDRERVQAGWKLTGGERDIGTM